MCGKVDTGAVDSVGQWTCLRHSSHQRISYLPTNYRVQLGIYDNKTLLEIHFQSIIMDETCNFIVNDYIRQIKHL